MHIPCLLYCSRPLAPNCKISPLKFWVSGFPYARCRELLPPQILDLRYVPSALAPKLCSWSTRPCLVTIALFLIGISDIAISICMNPVPTEFPISRYPMRLFLACYPFWLHQGPCDLHLCDHSPNSCRDSRFPITKIRRILNPKTPISDFAI